MQRLAQLYRPVPGRGSPGARGEQSVRALGWTQAMRAYLLRLAKRPLCLVFSHSHSPSSNSKSPNERPPLTVNFGPTHRYFSIGISTTSSQCIFIRTKDSGRVSGTVRNVYDVVQGQDLPEEKIRDTSSQLVGGAWVRFPSPLPRAGDRDAVESDPWIRAPQRGCPKPKRHGWGAMQGWTGPGCCPMTTQ